jgi:hypothetical protein
MNKHTDQIAAGIAAGEIKAAKPKRKRAPSGKAASRRASRASAERVIASGRAAHEKREASYQAFNAALASRGWEGGAAHEAAYKASLAERLKREAEIDAAMQKAQKAREKASPKPRKAPTRRAVVVDQHAITELRLYTENEAKLYPTHQAIAANLAKKIKKGAYDPAKAAKAWAYWYAEGTRRYLREHGSLGYPTATIARAAGAEYAPEWRNEHRIQEGI